MKYLNRWKNKPRLICFDFDGTLTKEDNFPSTTPADRGMVKLINALKKEGYYIIINSARDTIHYETVKAWLKQAGVKYDQLTLKAKPTADLYIDDKSFYLRDKHLLRCLIDMYFSDKVINIARKIAEGNFRNRFMENIANVPENPRYIKKKHRNFRVILPITGGMDSVTMWQMLKEAGTPFEMVYFDLGQSYAPIEIETAKKIVGDKITVIKKEFNFKRFKHIILGRNAIIILLLASYMRKKGIWGEIWFGNVQGESPILGGDKSRRFFNDIQHILSHLNYDVRVANPLIGMNKIDEVAYWNNPIRDINIFKETKSCFHPVFHQCGECQTCFRKYVAFKANGIDIGSSFRKLSFQPFIDKYTKVMGEAQKNRNYSHYSPTRIKATLKVILEL